MKSFALLFVLAALGQSPEEESRVRTEEDKMMEMAIALFDRYNELERSFDSAIADLYSDEAIIRNKRVYPDGTVREMSMPATDYKALLKSMTPDAEARGDRSTYSDVEYSIEGDGVRVRANRYSELKDYTSPLSLLLKPAGDGTWYIVEEISESRAVPPVDSSRNAETPSEDSVFSPEIECELLMNAVLPFAEEMLTKRGEFFPYAGAMTGAGEIQHVAGWTGDDNVDSTEIIQLLEGGLRSSAESGDYKCTAIVYDVLTMLPGKRKKQDAVAVALDHRDGYSAIVVHPYRLKGKKGVRFQAPLRGEGEGKIFAP